MSQIINETKVMFDGLLKIMKQKSVNWTFEPTGLLGAKNPGQAMIMTSVIKLIIYIFEVWPRTIIV